MRARPAPAFRCEFGACAVGAEAGGTGPRAVMPTAGDGDQTKGAATAVISENMLEVES